MPRGRMSSHAGDRDRRAGGLREVDGGAAGGGRDTPRPRIHRGLVRSIDVFPTVCALARAVGATSVTGRSRSSRVSRRWPKAAIVSGDLKWINENVGELTQKQLMFIYKRLEREAW